jgi:hypothetical protein
MVKAVKATLLHCNSTDASPRHHLCPPGAESWCKWQVACAREEEYRHHKAPIPEAIVHLLKLIYARLGNPSLLEKCIDGYTQNANELPQIKNIFGKQEEKAKKKETTYISAKHTNQTILCTILSHLYTDNTVNESLVT